MIIDKYLSSLINLSCHYVVKYEKIFYLNLKHKFKKTSCITQAHLIFSACSFLHSEGLVRLSLTNLGGSCLHRGGSWRLGAPSLVKLRYAVL